MPDGRYLYQSFLQSILDRTLAAAPLGDVIWARMNMKWAGLMKFHMSFKSIYPDTMFAIGYGGTYDFTANGYTSEEVDELHRNLARLGIVWQVQPAFAMQALNHVTRDFSRLWTGRGIGGYQEIQKTAMAADADGYEKMSWSGGYIADAITDTLGRAVDKL